MQLRSITGAALATVAALTLVSCGSDSESGNDEAGGQTTGEHEHHGESSGGATEPAEGTVLDTPFDKPDLVLTDTEGQPYDFAAETDGHATLLFFGYTHCPDVCPLTMSNIALATATLSDQQRADLRVVFVTTDPERDTPASLGDWLAAHDPNFVGLTGDFDKTQQAARSLGVHIEPSYEDDEGNIVSTHGAQVIAFLPTDDRAHVVYTEGVTSETFERDIPKLLDGELP